MFLPRRQTVGWPQSRTWVKSCGAETSSLAVAGPSITGAVAGVEVGGLDGTDPSRSGRVEGACPPAMTCHTDFSPRDALGLRWRLPQERGWLTTAVFPFPG
ncbi:hypothetical protein EMIHUDRAFT_256425 [Emiliania huxleyi CCMP1516]|uniref:Uncharacterized protein n=2 Tax=Emiliania huxleyi TaxID=2903 RepID=A0A0D3IW35_EMIH1|nr:hypothetical protein EMIHUDRAFT_256425 [Emiliania huxleyi CCMP1516]EOD15470.1 hypothetical protein EMIHUDRAFT_256425 [Emiliania huxleyi CCMP1516]|eukprot:XP_005767899.1 hypothetical protein EMIHUDRAFT_256425 [Emiliania huxleyi CCMP1516]